MNEAEVCQYLENNPDFLLKHPDLLAKLELLHAVRGLPSLPLLRLQQLRNRLDDCQQALQAEQQKQDLHNRRCRAMQQLAIEFLYIEKVEEIVESIDSVCSDEMSVSKTALRFWQSAPGIPQDYLLPKISQQPLLQRLDQDGFFWGSPAKAEKKLLLPQGDSFDSFVMAGVADAQDCTVGLLVCAGHDAALLSQEMDRPFLRFFRDLIQQMLIKCLHLNDLEIRND
jgi:uncharacterized protein YigA (DUF484 family)